MARAQELNSHFPTSKPASLTMVSISQESLSCSDPKPWNHLHSFFSDPTSNPAANPIGSTHSPPAVLASLLFLEHKYSSTPSPLHWLFPLPDTFCSIQVGSRSSPPPSFRALLKCHLLGEVLPTPLYRLTLLYPSLQHLPLPDSLHVLTDGSPHTTQAA